jgi:EmrB/QacA subfamily drug resistance transporter
VTVTVGRSSERWVLGVVAAASLMVALDTLVVSMALTTIKGNLGASVEELEWTINAYNLTLAVLLLPAAALGDRFGRRRMFATGLGLFIAASAACAVSPSVEALIAARAVQGAGGALVGTLSYALVSAAFPPERQGAAIGTLGGIVGLALIGGPVLGGAITAGIAWQWIFWLNVPIGLVVLPLVLAHVKESFGPDTALDIAGLALVVGAALGVTWALVRGNDAGWASLEVLASLAVGTTLAVGFVVWELRTRQPMLPMRLFASRAFSGGNAATFCLFATIFIGLFFIAQFLQTVLGYDPLEAGIRLLPWTALLCFVAPVVGRASDRIGERPLLVAGLTLDAVGYGWLALIAEPALDYSSMVLPLVTIALGGSMAIPPAATAVLRSMPGSAVGKASGANGMLRELGGVFGLAVAVAVFASVGSYASPAAFTDGLAPALGVACAFALAGAKAQAPSSPGARQPRSPQGASPNRPAPTTTSVQPRGAQMSLPDVVSRQEWVRARKELLAKEKEATRARDALNADRRRLPMVEIEKDYRFEGPTGQVGLVDLFEGRRQLIVDHYMFDPSWEDGCPSCAGRVDQYGNLAHLHERDTTIAVVSRAPLAKIERFKARMGWTFPWYSSYGSDFNYDFHVTLDEAIAPIEYNYRDKAELEQAGFPAMTGELHGTSVFLRDEDRVFHTYSTYGRGTEQAGGTHYYLDMTALGRQEDWEEPRGRATGAPRADQIGGS